MWLHCVSFRQCCSVEFLINVQLGFLEISPDWTSSCPWENPFCGFRLHIRNNFFLTIKCLSAYFIHWKSWCSMSVVLSHFSTRHWFHGKQIFHWLEGMGVSGRHDFRMIQAHYISCAVCFDHCYIRFTSDHQALDPRGWGPLLYGVLPTVTLNYLLSPPTSIFPRSSNLPLF